MHVENAATIARLPALIALSSSEHSRRAADRPPLPHTLAELIIPDNYRNIGDAPLAQAFVLYQSEDNSMLIFTTDRNIHRLHQMREWAMDGTFDAIPSNPVKLWQQMYTIQAFYRNKLFPLVYCLLTEKTAVTYTKVFRKIKDRAHALGLTLRPATIRADFETGLRPALALEFPDANLKCCHFHFCQAVYRNVVSEGLTRSYKFNPDFRQLVRELMALAFLPVNDIPAVYAELRMGIDFDLAQLAAPIFRYFSRQWMERTPLALWNVYQMTRRTNNNIEGWHSGFAKHTPDRPNIYDFLDSIVIEQKGTESTIGMMEAGTKVVRENRDYVTLNRRIDTITGDFDNGDITGRVYVRRIAFNLAQPLNIAL